MKKYLLALSIAILLLDGCAKIVVVKVPDTTANGADKLEANGMFYTLPKTVIRVGVKVDKTELKPARFAKFAAIFAPDGKPVCKKVKEVDCKKPDCKELVCMEKDKKGPKYELQHGATFITRGEPDPDNIYMVKFVGSGVNDQTLSMTWNDAGIVSTVSASVTNRTVDVVTSGIKSAAGLVSTLAFGAATKIVEGKPRCNSSSNNDEWIIPILKPRADGLLVNYYCEMEKSDRDSFNEANDKDTLTRAAEAYDNHVFMLAKGRASLLAGGSNNYAQDPTGMLTKLDALINQKLTDLYLGSKETETWEGSLDVRELLDGKGMPIKEIPILYIDNSKIDSKENGICLGNVKLAPDGKPYPKEYNILPDGECSKAAPVVLTLDYFPPKESQLSERVKNSTNEPSGKRSFFYRIPAQVKAELSGTKESKGPPVSYGAAVFSVAQWGTLVSLPANRHSQTLSYELAFIEATGGLRSFNLKTTGGLNTATVETLSGAAGTMIDAQKNKESNDLTQQYKILNLKDEICTIQKKYGQSCTVQP